MVTLTVTEAQAQYIAALLKQAQQAAQQYQQALALLALGTPADGLVLSDVNLDTSTLAFVSSADDHAGTSSLQEE